MKTRVSLLDWDGTLRRGYTTIDWLKFLNSHGIIHSSHITKLEQLENNFREGKILYDDFVQGAATIYGFAINGKYQKDIEILADQFVNIDETKLFSFSRPLLENLRIANIKVIVISGAPVEPLLSYSKRLPISKVLGVEISTDNGIYERDVKENSGLLATKIKIVRDILKSEVDVVLAIGNSLSDLPMLSVAEQGIFILEDNQKTPISFAHPDNLMRFISTNVF